MKDSILMAIESICDDIATNQDAEDNRKRAEAIAVLTVSGFMLPDDEDETAAAEDEPSTTTINKKLPKPGESFTYNGMEFVALGEEQGGLLAVAAKALEEEMPYDTGESNNWKNSSLRKFLNEEYVKAFNRGDLLPLVSDLTSDDGMKDYGTSEDYIALLSCDLYRKYRPYVPKYDTWVWTITPWSCLPGHAHYERLVNTYGSLSNNSAIIAFGVAPACIFNPAIFE